MTIHASKTGGYIAVQRVQDQRGEVNVGGWGITIEAVVAKCLGNHEGRARDFGGCGVNAERFDALRAHATTNEGGES